MAHGVYSISSCCKLDNGYGMGAHDEFSFWNMKICATANDAEL
jgi:hypothetical protein